MAQPSNNTVGVGTWALLGVGSIIGFAIVLWHFKHDAICLMALKYSYWVTFPFAKLAMLAGWESAPPVTLIKNIVKASGMVGKMQAMDLFTVLNKSGIYTLPFLYFTINAALRAHNHPYNHLSTKFNTWSLVRAQSKKNPCIVPVLRFEDKWRAEGKSRDVQLKKSQSPLEWTTANNLLLDSGSEISLNTAAARKLIAAQLGPKFSDMKTIPDYYKALAAIFIHRIEGRCEKARDAAQDMLDQINLSCDPSKEANGQFIGCFNFKKVATNFPKAMKTATAKRLLAKHSFGATFLMGLLWEARKDGKIPCSHFIWLKMVDRPLFYALQGVTPTNIARGFVEAAGPNAQFWAEMAAADYGQTLSGMYVDKAIPALEQRLLDQGAITRTIEYLND